MVKLDEILCGVSKPTRPHAMYIFGPTLSFYHPDISTIWYYVRLLQHYKALNNIYTLINAND
uniref:Uncharacterized protein n=1 Tax=Arundo donax TaxID=35708 RepID=A0A0A9B6E3_ARUDO